MRGFRTALALIALTALAACVTPGGQTDRLTLTTAGGGGPAVGPQMVTMPLQVVDVTVTVPRTLRVSEAEVFYPIADIVWRGDPRGDRYAQIEAIYDTAVRSAIAPLTSGIPVVAEIEVRRFHCLTDKTRYTFGGVHALSFALTIRDAATGEILSGPRLVNADAKAHGGQRAIAEDAAGITQKAVVTGRLAEILRQELAQLNVDPARMGVARGPLPDATQALLDPALVPVP